MHIQSVKTVSTGKRQMRKLRHQLGQCRRHGLLEIHALVIYITDRETK